MAQTLDTSIGVCPLCGEQMSLDVAEHSMSPKWRDALAHRDKFAELSRRFRELQSLDEAAKSLSISSELALRLLDFICIELCGCRTVTCVSCLDDYRSEL